MSKAIGSSRELNSSRRICLLRAVLLGHVVDVFCFIDSTSNANVINLDLVVFGQAFTYSMKQCFGRRFLM